MTCKLIDYHQLLPKLARLIILCVWCALFPIVPCWEKLCDDSCFEAMLHQAEGCPEAGTSSTDDDGVICVVYDWVLTGGGGVGCQKIGSWVTICMIFIFAYKEATL